MCMFGLSLLTPSLQLSSYAACTHPKSHRRRSDGPSTATSVDDRCMGPSSLPPPFINRFLLVKPLTPLRYITVLLLPVWKVVPQVCRPPCYECVEVQVSPR